MPRWLVVGVFVCAALAATPAHAQYFGRNKVHYDTLRFRVLQTDHFDIYYYDDEEEATRHAARMAERWYARLSTYLGHTFTRRQPLILYASHPHFAQTNVSAGSPGEGVGGLTERSQARIALPFAAGLAETDHVLGHEIAHAFQIDIAKRAKQDAFMLPGWLIEGMAEFLSLGGDDPHTDMWLRDAALHERLPSIERLGKAGYFPYRYGHAFWAYLVETFGDGVVPKMLRSRTSNIIKRLEEVTGNTRDELTSGWHESIAAAMAASADRGGLPVGRLVLRTADGDRTRFQVGPSLSPDGSKLMFLSERDRLSLDLFMADASTGDVMRKVASTAGNTHLESLQYIHSAGAWDATGTRFAFAALGRGEPILTIADLRTAGDRQAFTPRGLDEIYNPSWSPDGTQVVFSGLKGGLSDLFVFTVATQSVRRLTADAFADLHPAWSPDGRTIAFASDRFTSTIDDLRFGPLRVALLDLESGQVRPAAPEASDAKQINPQWDPTSQSVYFVSDRTGVSNVYRVNVSTAALRQVTDVRGGVSGITATSPAIAVASETGTLAYTVYRAGRYEIRVLDDNAHAGREVLPMRDVIETPAHDASISALLADATTGLPDAATFTSVTYDDRLRLESILQPYVGASTGAAFGGLVRATFGLSMGDVLRDRQLQTLVRLGTDLDDFAGQLSYSIRRSRWNWGMTGGMAPSRFIGAHRAMERQGELLTRETSHLRYLHQWGQLTGRYHVNGSQRFEFGAGVRRTGFEWQRVTRVSDTVARETISRVRQETSAGAPLYLAEAHAAFVHDTSVHGLTGPVAGQRYRLELEPAIGTVSYADVRADFRRYFMPVRPVTIAARLQHVGRYGSTDARLTPLVVGLQSLVRGYNLHGFAADECGAGATECSLMDQLAGSRVAVMNLELRAPVMGLFTGRHEYGAVPLEAIVFADAGMLWTRQPGQDGRERDRFRSIGAGARANVGGIVFEMTAARPFDRPMEGWALSFLISPGF